MTPGPGVARTPLPKGFFAGGINCGVRKYRPDLGMIVSETDATAAAVFTRNEMKAAPIYWCQKLVPSSKIRAIITNSGQANAATGSQGVANNLKMVQATAEVVKCAPEQILAASTGVIGQHLAMELILQGIPELYSRLSDAAENFAVAVLTTDLVPKTVTTTVKLSGGEIRVTGICKGSGMIHPNMGTMLGYVLTDAGASAEFIHQVLQTATDESFNMISVDGDTSTNDTVFLLANGASGVQVNSDADKKIFLDTIIKVCQFLARSIARDGEGANKLIEVNMKGAKDLAIARKAARGITLSPLIKTAIAGEDPNWGRLMARLGAEGVPAAELEKLTLSLQGQVVFEKGGPASFDREKLRGLLRSDTVTVDVVFPDGAHSCSAWGCDLTKKYVEINAEYTT